MTAKTSVGTIFLPIPDSPSAAPGAAPPLPSITKTCPLVSITPLRGQFLSLKVRATSGAILQAHFHWSPLSGDTPRIIQLGAFTTGPVESIKATIGSNKEAVALPVLRIIHLPQEEEDPLPRPLLVITGGGAEVQVITGYYLTPENIFRMWNGMGKKLTVLLFSMLFGLFAGAQNTRALQALSIGDFLPETTLAPVLNHPAGRLSFSRRDEKVLLLTFMATSCKPCLQKLPDLNALQKRYGDRLQILLVTTEGRERVEKFIGGHKLGKSLQLPIAVGDSFLSALFPHDMLSHEVWIRDGVVTAITSSDYVTPHHVDQMLSRKTISWPVKRDLAYFDYSQPLLAKAPQAKGQLKELQPSNYTTFSNYLPGVPYRYIETKDTQSGYHRTMMVNMSLIAMYLKTLSLPVDYPTASMVLRVRDTARLVYNPVTTIRDAWKRANLFCYEAVLPPWDKETRHRKIQSDLDSFSGLRVSLQPLKLTCLILIRLKSNDSTDSLQKKGQTSKQICVNDLVFELARSRYGQPVINESGLGKETFLPVPLLSYADTEAVNRWLLRYGLKLIAREQTSSVLIFEDRKEQILLYYP